MKTTIVISGSLKRFGKEIEVLGNELRDKGYFVYYPEVKSLRLKNFDSLNEIIKRDTAKGITLEYFEYIRRADVMFVYNKDGYSGNSTTLEIGFAML